jgi:hypothetical protein
MGYIISNFLKIVHLIKMLRSNTETHRGHGGPLRLFLPFKKKQANSYFHNEVKRRTDSGLALYSIQVMLF